MLEKYSCFAPIMQCLLTINIHNIYSIPPISVTKCSLLAKILIKSKLYNTQEKKENALIITQHELPLSDANLFCCIFITF